MYYLKYAVTSRSKAVFKYKNELTRARFYIGSIIKAMRGIIDKRYRRYVQSFFLVLPMTGIVTIINTFIAKGLAAVLTVATLERWGISLLIAFPIVLFIQPLAVKVTDYFMKNDQK